ncbi:MAG: MoaD/ThiS family protein [Candidatus Natronoplasma sp.]
MSIDIILYGDLKSKSDNTDGKTGSIGKKEIEKDGLERISDILEHIGLDEDEVSHIFLNRDYSAVEREVKDGDRVALFPKDMALLYKWYFAKKK